MFENVIRQDEVVAVLGEDLRNGRLPASLLFSGPEYSGKLTSALELARALGCENREAPWNCGCRSCESHRLLLHPYTAMLGGRYFHQEISACLDALKRTGNPSSRFLFIRSVRKLTRRFDPFLWEGEEQKVQKVTAHVQALEDVLLDLSPGNELPPAPKLEKLAESVLASARKVLDGVNLDVIPVSQIRRVSSWAHLGAAGARKIVILENADRMLDSAKNALLKILEEPPAHVSFVLLTSRRGTVLPTILSRVRTYSFKERDSSASREVLERIFRETSVGFADLREYFLVFQDMNPQTLRNAALVFLKSSLSPKGGFPDFSGAVPEDGSLFSDRGKFRLFLQELLSVFRESLRGKPPAEELSGIPLERFEDWSRLVGKTAASLDTLNLSPGLLAQRLHSLIGRAA